MIGAGGEEARDMPDGSVAVGNPRRVIRRITDEDRGTCLDRAENLP